MFPNTASDVFLFVRESWVMLCATVTGLSGVRGLFAFGGEVRGELAKVDFPNRQQTWHATMVVIAACLIVGAYLYGLDQVFARFATKLVDLQR